MPTIDWGPSFNLCVRAVEAALGTADELLVVFDGPLPHPLAWLISVATAILHTGSRGGPAAARNCAAREARNELLMFVDADVELHSDAIQRVRSHFAMDPRLDAVFGSYDDRPAAEGLVSQFRNLLHHYTHTSQAGRACTFWAGCGAVRRKRFLSLGGFDANAYRLPCIEDVEFGVRLFGAEGVILLDPSIQGTHHKCWTLASMLRTDILQRAIPWSQLIVSRREFPATLNLSVSSRISGGLSLVMAFSTLLALSGLLHPWSWVAAISAWCLFLILNRRFLALLWKQGGPHLVGMGGGLLWLYYFYSTTVFALVSLLSFPKRFRLNRNDVA